MKPKKIQLKNGLQVLLQESHKSPIISIQMWVRTGSADERKGEEGISHFIEHLVFKGTKKFKVGQIASLIEGSGGELNAYTSFDQTVFYVTISKHFVNTGLEAISQMMGHPQFDTQEIENEREVVVEEIKRGNDSLSRRASQLMFSTNYSRHPYGIPVIGYEKNVRSWPAKKIIQYYKDRYSPRNMFLVVCGDFNTREMQAAVAQYFSDFQDNKIRKTKRKPEAKKQAGKVKIENANFEQSIAYLTWPAPSIKHKDSPGLDVLAIILGQGDSSRLVKKMRIDSALANSVGASNFSPLDDGLFAISIGYNKENLSKILSATTEEIEKILREGVEVEEIKKAIVNLESEEFYTLETVDGLSRKVGSLEFYFRDQEFQNKYLKSIRALTPVDIQKIANKYLKKNPLSVSVITNDQVKNANSIITSWKKVHDKAIAAVRPVKTSSKKIKYEKLMLTGGTTRIPTTEKIVLGNGVTVLFRENKESQTISVKAAALGGLRSEPEPSEGLTELLSRVWVGGTKHKSESEIYSELESIAAGVSANAGRNSIGLSAEMLSMFEERAADLYLDILCNPTLPSEVIEREKLVQLEHIKSKKDNPAQICVRTFSQHIFSGHPYQRDMLGSEESLAKINRQDVLAHWQNMLTRNNTSIIISGHARKDLWLKRIEKYVSALPSGERFSKVFPVTEITKDIHVYEKSEKEQSHVVYGFRGLKITDQNRYALHIIQSILAGQGGRLFIELRDKNSLAYSVSPLRQEGLELGYFGAYIGCSPEKVSKALEMMRQQFDRLVQEKVTQDELDRAIRYLIGRHDIDLQRTSAVAASILYDDIYGIDHDETFNMAQKYSEVSTQDIRDLAEKIFSQKHVISVVGAQNPWGL